MNKKFLLLFLVIIALGALPRMIEVLGGNYLFGFDQGLFYQDVKKIVIDHRLTLIGPFSGGQGGLFQGPGWYYLLSIPFILAKGDPMGGMVMMLVIGLSTVALSIYLANKMFGPGVGLLIGFLIATSAAIISQSIFIWPPFPVSLITVAYLYFIYRVFKGEDKFLIPAFFSIGLISHFEIAMSADLTVQFFLLLVFLLTTKRTTLKSSFLSIAAFILTLSPLIVFNFKHNSILIKGLFNSLPKDSSTHQVTRIYIERMFQNHLDNFKYSFLSTFNLSDILWPVIVSLLIFGGFLYLKSKKVKQHNKMFLAYLLISPIILFLIFMLYLWPIWQWWLLELMIFYIFAFAILADFLWKDRRVQIVIVAMLLSFFASFVKDSINFYRHDLRDYGGTAKIKGKEDVIDYIYKDAKGQKFGLLIFSPPVYTFAYDYLLWWYGEKKYGYFPSKEKKGTFYLLIEPDPSKPWSYKGWIETVVKTGRVINTITLPSGFIVQKRNEI